MAFLTRERDRDFVKQCRLQKEMAVNRGEILTEKQIVERAVKSPAPGYYIDYGYALSRFYRMNNNNEAKRELKRLMWKELRSKVAHEIEKTSGNVADALHNILAQEQASRFFINTEQGMKLYAKFKRNRPRRPIDLEQTL